MAEMYMHEAAFGARQTSDIGNYPEGMVAEGTTTESVVVDEIVEVNAEPIKPEALPSVTDSLMAVMEPFAEEITVTSKKIADIRERLTAFIAETEQLGNRYKATVDEKTELIASLHNLTNKVAEYQEEIGRYEKNIQKLTDQYQTIERSLGAAVLAGKKITSADRLPGIEAKNAVDAAYFELDCLQEQKRNAESKIQELRSNIEQLDYIVTSIEDRLRRIGILVGDYQAEYNLLMGSKAVPAEKAAVYPPIDLSVAYPVNPQGDKQKEIVLTFVRKGGTPQ